METDYDRKFEEMKKYIPFLENMISRLEGAGSTTSNPRQAQLAKIRSLRDLLLDKKKRMKMENLMKCEQVLVNLYAKIEQRDSFFETNDTGSKNVHLDLVRSKLKKVTARLQESETLPEIVGPSRTEEVTAGSKEPALFQKRPIKAAISPPRCSLTDSDQSSSTLNKRNYTRVLVSPDRDSNHWKNDTASDKALSSIKSPIRTPKKSPRNTTSFQHKRDRKKSSSQARKTSQLKDLNITLKVPEESLNSLNTKDILSRIINCSDNDVDIETLRGLRTQILSELKQTGAKDDISDLILKSYKHKKKSGKKKEEFEEGELSDSESEIIESIYGSLVVVDKDQDNSSSFKNMDEKDELPRKIQICLVINSEKESQNETITNHFSGKSTIVDVSDFESFQNNTNKKLVEIDTEKEEAILQNDSGNTSSVAKGREKHAGVNTNGEKSVDIVEGDTNLNEKCKDTKSISNHESQLSEVFSPSFYKSTLNEDSSSNITQPTLNLSSSSPTYVKTDETIIESKLDEKSNKLKDSIDIPLLDLGATAKQEVVQEIDILQALKKEILSEKISLSDSETITPPLHQPKVTKVANMEKILPKKRISIEKYKEKSTSVPRLSQSTSEGNSSKDELLKKQSLKLTEKEYERFYLSTDMSLDEASDEEDNGKMSPPIEDIYGGLAPKSPDHEDFADTGIKPPIIIPADPVKAEVVPSKNDVDMRMMPIKPHSNILLTNKNIHFEKLLDGPKKETELNVIDKVSPLADPRVRRDFSNANVESGNIGSTEHISRTQINLSPNMTPTRVPNMTLNRMCGITQTKLNPNVVPNLSSVTMGYEMTPSRQSFENDNYSKQDHVYAPIFPVLDPNDIADVEGQNVGHFSRLRDDSRNNLGFNNSDIQNSLYVENSFNPSECPSTSNHSFGRPEMPMTPIHAFGRTEAPMTPAHLLGRSDRTSAPSIPFGRLDCPPTPSYPFGRSDCPSTPSHPFGRTDCPSTPSHPFGRSDCPSTPSHPFGRSDCPPTPSHPFGRTDCPSTTSHPFGRMDCPSTPSHSFGRSDCPSTPSHPFGRMDCPSTPSHPFGRMDCPSTPSHPFGRTDCSSTSSHLFGRKELITPSHPFGRGDFSQNQTTSQIAGVRYNNFQNSRINRCSEYDNLPFGNDDIDYERNLSNFNTRSYKYEDSKRSNPDSYRNYDRHVSRRESSIGSTYRNYKIDRRYSNDRGKAYSTRDYRYEDSGRIYNDSGTRRNYRREHSVGRNLPDDKHTRSNKEKDFRTGNTLSIKSNTGRSFTIDTSVNRSFQETISKFKNEYIPCADFGARRRRASSVGRHLVRDPSVERVLLDNDKKRQSPKLKTNFRRAHSVGRELSGCHSSKKFEDIKEELQSYKHTNDKKNNKTCLSSSPGFVDDIRKKINDRDPRLSRRDRQTLETCKKEDQSAKPLVRRGDIRDPRLQRGPNKDNQSKFHGAKSLEESKKQGIVYSNDNIAKGTILGSGYGVKNYKIPKIKRAPEEICSQETIDSVKDETDKSDKNYAKKKQNDKEETNSFKVIDKEKYEENPTSIQYDKISVKLENGDIKNNDKNGTVVENIPDNVEKRITRSSSKISGNEIVNDVNSDKKSVLKKTRNRIKKSIQHYSDSDDDNTPVVKISQNSKEYTVHTSIEKERDSATSNNDNTSSDWDNIKPTENEKKAGDSASGSNFDEEVSKPIKNLISNEDLSNYIPDSDNCFGMDLEMFPDNLTTDPVIENINDLIADLDDDLETSKNDGNRRQFTKEIILENMLENITCVEKKDSDKSDYENKITEVSESSININQNDMPANESTNKSDPDGDNGEVSTTENEIKPMIPQKTISKCYDDDDICSTPDSTIHVNENDNQEKVPDSTGEISCEMSSDITSTEVKDTVQTNTSHTDVIPQSDSIGSLLSILKDKSKIQELLTMIKDQSNGDEKLKRKLEMLSEIVSDDEDLSNSSPTLVTNTSKITNEKDVTECTMRTDEPMSDKDCGEDIKNIELGRNIDAVPPQNSVEIDSTTLNKDQEENRKENIESEENSEALQRNIENNDNEDDNDDMVIKNELSNTDNKSSTKNTRSTKKTKGRLKTRKLNAQKPPTRSSTSLKIDKSPNVKKPSRELKQLQDDIKEMFLNDDVFNSTGIRMCRLAKLVEDKSSSDKGEPQNVENSPVVILQKIKQSSEETNLKSKTSQKKQPLKTKSPQKQAPVRNENNEEITTECKLSTKHKPGPKSKTKVLEQQTDVDPYMFESDSVSESTDTNISEKHSESASDSECGSLASSKSFGSNEQLVELKKKPKRKRRGWQAGVIKSKNKKKKIEINQSGLEKSTECLPETSLTILDEPCFTDKTYCFSKNVSNYSCRLCSYIGSDIVHHYKKGHPHSEIPLSRMSPDIAKEAIEQSEEFNFQTISKLPFDKYVCRFCFEEFSRRKTVLETFFWHVVSTHTGEYKQFCSECTNEKKCPFNLDIPPPPKDPKGQLIGYICGKCNFTQISLENLKTHVINRHNDEETEVYTINLGVMSKKMLALTKATSGSEPRVLRSSRAIQNTAEMNDELNQCNETTEFETNGEKPDVPTETNLDTIPKNKRKKMKSQIYFENDEVTKEICELNKVVSIKVEPEQDNEMENATELDASLDVATHTSVTHEQKTLVDETEASSATCNDVLDYPHFKVNYTQSGTKEYVCCINGAESHYRTALLISFKKHVQLKHSENWDGFCFLCKLIVTPQGTHFFKDCLQHFLDKHIDNFPTMEYEENPSNTINTNVASHKDCDLKSTTSHLSVRSLSELISPAATQPETALPIIESVVSLGATTDDAPQAAIANLFEVKSKQNTFKYEEAQAEVMNMKNKVVLEVMMDREKLVHIFKCAGRFCSYSTDDPGEALRHAITHERAGGQRALDCIYCDFDSSHSAVDLVTHVFKAHGGCRYTCGHCFYRAATAQLVRAHALRLHPSVGAQSLILRTTAVPRSEPSDNILTREIAVPYYVCNQSGGSCKFRTYTSGKFCEHLHLRHQMDDYFLCSVCSLAVAKPTDLIEHMKVHGYKFYQCTWCVHGADDEAALLAHASHRHPAQQPQAYLRVITNKEGNAGFRVLPLAQLNVSKIATVDVTPSSVKKDPGREAERSIDLEKLIGQTAEMIESMATPVRVAPAPSDGAADDDDVRELLFNPDTFGESQSASTLDLQSSIHDQIEEVALVTAEKVSAAPPAARALRPQHSAEGSVTPALKSEPKQNTSNDMSTDVICLDSDDDHYDDALEVSANETEQLKLVARAQLFKCGICPNVILKTALIFKRHLQGVHMGQKDIPCAHCSAVLAKATMAEHYQTAHYSNRRRPYICELCNEEYTSIALVRKHLQQDHGVARHFVTSKVLTEGKYQFFVGEAAKKKASKRTLSNETEKKSPHQPVKIRKFGPGDVHRLPINPILDELVFCAVCEYSTKVRLNMARHLQLHAARQPAPNTAPVNPVPHLETNEKHFDKMVNLASSSIASRADRGSKPERPPATSTLAPERAALYPKYVADRQRYTCGARGCCYISVSETMLKRHWEALHSAAGDFHCAHCPPSHQLDASKQLTAARIVAHMKMHDAKLYACSACPYYHHRRQMVEKHITELHGGTGQVLVVREEPPAPAPGPAPPPAATPTMDLKPWQCGLCKFKSMLRPEVVEHCAKVHNCKMQYKCYYCAFRTSTLENVTKHRAKSHPERADETFYVYYREGTVPDESDGTPRWQRQRLGSGLAETRVKTESVDGADLQSPSLSLARASPSPAQVPAPGPQPVAPAVDLNIVKREPDATAAPERAAQDLCETFGQLCEPDGLRYKCPLCNDVAEENREEMQSHLYEELKCRKWGCGFCSYKAFHKAGLSEHMTTEHRRNRDAIELPVDPRLEMWIAKVLDHQFLSIEKNRKNPLKEAALKCSDSTIPSPPTARAALPEAVVDANNYSTEDLEKSFGKFGASEKGNFSCPKCGSAIRDEKAMREHLEIELNKIRWCCSSCSDKFQNYHEAQFHCKTAHAQLGARAVEAPRDGAMRCAWITAAVAAQKLSITLAPAPRLDNADDVEQLDSSLATDNSLLEVRYEERVDTPEVHVPRPLLPHLQPPPRPPPYDSDDDDDDKLVIDEPAAAPAPSSPTCPFCAAVFSNLKEFRSHVAHHDDIKPYFCSYCDFNGYRSSVLKHLHDKHENLPARLITRNQRASGPALSATLPLSATQPPLHDLAKLICLSCEKAFTEGAARLHIHDGDAPAFAKEGEIVVKCCACHTLHKTIEALTAHHEAAHSDPPAAPNYAYYKVRCAKKSFSCAHCLRQFKYLHHLKAHTEATHGNVSPGQTNHKRPFAAAAVALSDVEEPASKRHSADPSAAPAPKRCARKSTTKLPAQAVAKKSTAKLSFYNKPQSELDEYSFYGTRPRLDELGGVTTRVSLGGAAVVFSFRQLTEVMSVCPAVLVRDIASPDPRAPPRDDPSPI